MRLLATLTCALALSACATLTPTTIAARIDTAYTDYGYVKAALSLALIAEPQFAPQLTAAEAVIDGLFAAARAATTAAEAESLLAQAKAKVAALPALNDAVGARKMSVARD